VLLLAARRDVFRAVAVDDVLEGVCGAQDSLLVDSVAAGADEGPFNVGTQRLSPVLGATVLPGGA